MKKKTNLKILKFPGNVSELERRVEAILFSADEPFSVPSSDNLIFFNDLEIPAFKLAPNLQQIRNGLQKLGFSQVVMTGSGTAFFCIGDVVSPQYPGILFYQVKDTYRSSSTWY